ncbi:MAG: neutral/alkaline non-lysosomal ceramidase N-terminal domain-containing protein [Deltaproteobacteria bacterium]|nr:neutral/alkaline non-lysosomal ceramidase N-terminal domain-containing protein [Deltaproteobacteria bacterium]
MRRAALLALAALAGSGCHPLDRRPPFGQAEYARHHAAVSAAAAATQAHPGALQAGWARVQIVAPEGVPLAGYGDREGAPSEGTRDPVYVRAFAVATDGAPAVILTADLLLLGPNVVDEVRARLADALPADALFFTASHTHSGPGGYMQGLLWEAVLGPYDEAAYEAVVSAHVDAAGQALAALAPAKVGSATARVPALIMNRVEKRGPVDDQLLLVSFERLADGKKAALWLWGCHAVTLPAENMRISADYPGAVARAFEGSAVEVMGFAAGGVGSANPRYERPDAKWLVRPLEARVQEALHSALRSAKAEGKLAFARRRISRPDLHYRVERELEVWSGPIAMLVDMPHLDFSALALDDLVLLGMPAELSGELTREARRRAATSGVRLAVLPFNGTYLGYVVPRRVYDLPDEAGEEMLHYETHVVSFLGPWGADYLMNLGLRLAGGVHARAHPPAPDQRFEWISDSAAVNAGAAPRPGETETSYPKAGSSN